MASRPPGLCTAPPTSLTAITRMPADASKKARVPPTLPNPCTMARLPGNGMSSVAKAARTHVSTPLAVAPDETSLKRRRGGVPLFGRRAFGVATRATPGERLRLLQRGLGVGGIWIDGHPPLGRAHRVAPTVVGDRFTNCRRENARVSAQQCVPFLVGPLVEPGRMSELQSVEKVRYVDFGGVARRRIGRGEESAYVAFRFFDEEDGAAVDVQHVADRVAQMRERLAQRCASFLLRVVAPEQRHDLVAAVLARLERQVREQRDALAAELGRRQGRAVDSGGDAAAQRE